MLESHLVLMQAIKTVLIDYSEEGSIQQADEVCRHEDFYGNLIVFDWNDEIVEVIIQDKGNDVNWYCNFYEPDESIGETISREELRRFQILYTKLAPIICEIQKAIDRQISRRKLEEFTDDKW